MAFTHTLPSGLTLNFRIGRLDDMPRCKVCGKAICSHSDLEFAGIAPASTPDPMVAQGIVGEG